jgi:hypothetical protein
MRVSERELRAARQRPVPAPLGFVGSVAAGFQTGLLEERSDSFDRLIRGELTASLGRLEELTGDSARYGNLPSGPWGNKLAEGLLRRLEEAEPEIQTARTSNPELEELRTADEIRERARARAERARAIADTAGGFGSFVGTAGAILADPPNLLSLPIGVGRSVTILKAMLGEGAINAGVEAYVQSTLPGVREVTGREQTLGETLRNVAIAAGGAAAFEGLMRGIGRIYDRGAGEVFQPTAEQRAARDVVDDAAEVSRSNPRPQDGPAGETAHLEQLQRAHDDLVDGRVGSYDELVARERVRVEEIESRMRAAGDEGLAELRAREQAVADLQGRVRDADASGGARVGPFDEIRLAETRRDMLARQMAGEEVEEPFEAVSRAFEAEAELPSAQAKLTEARSLAARVRDGVILDRGGRPFASRRAARRFAETQTRISGEFQVVKSGRGYAISPVTGELPLDLVRTRKATALQEERPATVVDADGRFAEAPDDMPAPVRAEEPAPLGASGGAGSARATPDPDGLAPLEEFTPAFRKQLDENPDALVDTVDRSAGDKVRRRAADVADEIDHEQATFEALRDCVIG